MRNVIQNLSDNCSGSRIEDLEFYINEYERKLQDFAFDDARQISADMQYYLNDKSTSFKVGRNPETHENLNSLDEYKPMELNLDNSKYNFTPAFTQPNIFPAIIVVIMFFATTSLLTVYILHKRK